MKKLLGDYLVIGSFILGVILAVLSMTLFDFNFTQYIAMFVGILLLMLLGVVLQYLHSEMSKVKDPEVLKTITDELNPEYKEEETK